MIGNLLALWIVFGRKANVSPRAEGMAVYLLVGIVATVLAISRESGAA
jgi:F0F1-type ATP synthase assembly protein I